MYEHFEHLQLLCRESLLVSESLFPVKERVYNSDLKMKNVTERRLPANQTDSHDQLLVLRLNEKSGKPFLLSVITGKPGRRYR